MTMAAFFRPTPKQRLLNYLSQQAMKVQIQLDEGSQELRSGFQCIRGKVDIVRLENYRIQQTSTPVWEFVVLQIQLEGTSTGILKNTDQLRNEKVELIIHPTAKQIYLCQPFIHPTEKERKRIMPMDNYSFPFAIQLQGENFPASYSGPYGRIEYKLVVYVGLKNIPIVEAAEEVLKTKGYVNLALDPLLDQQAILTKRRAGLGFFSSSSRNSQSQQLEVRLILNKRGFIPGETIKCSLQVDNPTGERISKLSVSLVQRMVNCVSLNRRFTQAQLDSRHVNCETADEKIQWDAEFPVSENLLPTFTGKKKTMEILYFLQFAVEFKDYDQKQAGPCKGETMIIIGTTRSDLKDEMTQIQGASEQVTPLSVQFSAMSLSTSMASLDMILSRSSIRRNCWDTMSLQSYSTAPPAYSSLSSRQPTLESLPPAYSSELCLSGP